MPLIQTTLNIALEEAFDKALFVFAQTIAKSPQGTNVADNARKSAAKTFAALATPAIDVYIKSATIIVPPGQAVTTAGSPAAQAGSTVSPSAPAIIS